MYNVKSLVGNGCEKKGRREEKLTKGEGRRVAAEGHEE